VGTTLIIVELVIIGFQVLVWITLLLWPVLKPNLVHLKHLKDWVPVVALSVLAMAYTLGIVFDRSLGCLTSTLKLTSKETQETLKRNHYYIMLNNPETYRQWENVERRVYLLRATFFNSFIIAGIVWYKYRSRWKIWLPLAILAIAFITWCEARLRSDDALVQLYKTAKLQEKKTEK